MKNKLDPKEFELPDTVVVRDIEDCVFQSIILQCLSKIEGISLLEGNFMDHLLGRPRGEQRVRGIYVDQDSQNHSINIKVEVNIYYGVSIPSKSEEIHSKIIEEITRLTGLHIACVHVIFKNLLLSDLDREGIEKHTSNKDKGSSMLLGRDVYDEYADEL